MSAKSEAPENTQSRTAMFPFSFDLINGCHYFAQAAASESETKRRRYLNTACVIFAAGTIEAVLNELIAVHAMPGNQSNPNAAFYSALSSAQKAISLKDKWNLFASVRGGHTWDSAAEPFQSYDTIITIRNELLHYKADFLGHLEPPVNRIRPLLHLFGIPETRTGDNIVLWLHALLESRGLGAWVLEKLRYSELLSLGKDPS